MNERWRNAECQHAPICAITCQHGPTLQFVSCAEKDSLCGTVMMGLNRKCLDQCHGVRSHGTSSSQSWCKRIVIQSESLVSRKHAFVDISVFSRLDRQRQVRLRPAQGFFHHFTEQLKLIAQMNPDWKVDKAQYAEFNVPTCGKIAVWQLCRETQPLWNSHDSWWPGLNLRCLDQCHGVRSHGKSSYQGWRKRTCCTVQIWSMSLHPCLSPKVILAGLP